MNFIKNLKYQGAALLAAAVLFPALAQGSGEYGSLAAALVRAASSHGLERVAMGAFSPAGASAEEEARFATEKTAAGLAAGSGIQFLDLVVLEAAVGGREGWLARLPAKTRPQALIKGTVFKEGEKITVIARLVEASTGRVLASLQAVSGARFSEVPPVPDMDWGAAPEVAAVKDPFRDAPSDGGFDCSGAFKEMDRVNAGAADIKARYWAAKMKEPGFVVGSLTRNPGSEIRDPQVKQKFYDLLSGYYAREEAPVISRGQTAKLEEFMGRESGVIDRCGIK
ncbi:MAG: hypothetical protein PHV33_09100 [Elusimicrobiales bacterium]|nr:hypothetical protein [Elusimicrobiales bacterium]